jgi:hypothetical protein
MCAVQRCAHAWPRSNGHAMPDGSRSSMESQCAECRRVRPSTVGTADTVGPLAGGPLHCTGCCSAAQSFRALLERNPKHLPAAIGLRCAVHAGGSAIGIMQEAEQLLARSPSFSAASRSQWPHYSVCYRVRRIVQEAEAEPALSAMRNRRRQLKQRDAAPVQRKWLHRCTAHSRQRNRCALWAAAVRPM